VREEVVGALGRLTRTRRRSYPGDRCQVPLEQDRLFSRGSSQGPKPQEKRTGHQAGPFSMDAGARAVNTAVRQQVPVEGVVPVRSPCVETRLERRALVSDQWRSSARKPPCRLSEPYLGLLPASVPRASPFARDF
jgi:hypothetical protein